MNEKDLEKRLRSVRSGRQPAAPQSLRAFLRELPEAEARRRRGPLGVVRHVLGAVPSLAPGLSAPRKLQVAAAVSLALLISLAGAGLLLSLRQVPRQPLASRSPQTSVPTEAVTPRRTTPSLNIIALELPDNPYWYGTTQLGNDDAAFPIETAARPDGSFIGVSAAPWMNGIVRSKKGLLWDWSPISEIDSGLSGLASIAGDTTGRTVVVGWATGAEGVKDGRAYYSDEAGTWSPAADQSVFAGTVVRKVVHGPNGFLALGWNEGSQADAIRPITEWVSGDGVTWTRVSSVPIRGTSAFLLANAAGYVLSGTPIKTGNVDQPPFWYSTNGTNWQRATATDNTAQKLGPLVSLTLVGGAELIGLSGLSDGMAKQLVESSDGGRTWHALDPQGIPDPTMLTHVASLSGGSMAKDWLIATYTSEYARLYLSGDGGRNWTAITGEASSPPPLGTMLVEVGSGYGVGSKRVLACSDPSLRSGPWIASVEQLVWP